MSEDVAAIVNGAVTLGTSEVWREANVTFRSSTINVILGPNGAGKSTMLRTLLGVVELTHGEVRILGEPVRRGDRRLGYLPQSRSESLNSITARDYVGLALSGVRIGWQRYPHLRQSVDRALALTGAQALADRPLGTLSGGQRQRVGLAHATISQPKLLLLDEPLATLDLAAQTEVVDLINVIRVETGAAIVVVAHDLNPLASVTDQVLWIARRQVRVGSIDDIVNEEVLSDLYGHPIEIVTSARGRRVIVGLEEEFAHPHPHGFHHDHEVAHEHLSQIYTQGDR